MHESVENCLALDTRALSKAKVLRPGVYQEGLWGWATGQSIRYIVDTLGQEHDTIRLLYDRLDGLMDYVVELQRHNERKAGNWYQLICHIRNGCFSSVPGVEG